ncbi:hypothetical protein Theam_1815 (plasmid) [Thermovibrio ammonificans HB-1]|uniref:DUF2997 domain-containing protein n=1 Tax=Thermovibrio ammonificans (strain DSM 15698 / JCM 12110 / HB-1) TaxID=648996 RepID=E8T6U8_THEA1|nr:DUF2997 domain-containing protein [Thermovibrio ammonificans]ADU97771.1 hypothetical protein Theam_1815 [Thermovibrio ammonificans HB-1]
MKEKMIVVVRPDGSVEIETVGFKGKACVDFARPFKEALGEVEAERKKPEYYARGEVKKWQSQTLE